MNITSKEFGELIKKHTRILLEGVSVKKKLSMSFMDLNREAVKLAQDELRQKKKENRGYIVACQNREELGINN